MKDVFFNIRFRGQDVAIKNATDLRLAIREIKKEMDVAADDNVYKTLEEDSLRLKAQLKNVQAEQRKTIKEFQLEDDTIGAYKRLTLQLQLLRDAVKDKQAAGEIVSDEELEKVQALDKRLKDIDGSVGQFQRNVGNYPQTFSQLVTGLVPGLGDLKEGFDAIGDSADVMGKRIAGAFFVFQLLSVVVEQIGVLIDDVDEFNEKLKEVDATTRLNAESTEELTVGVKALSEALEVDFGEALKASNQLITRFGTDGEEAVDLIGEALLRVGDRGAFLSNVNEELKKLVGIGLDDRSAIGLLVEATNRGFNVDVFTEPLIALRERTKAADEALEAAFGRERTEELFETFQKAPVEAIKQISEELGELDDTAPEVGRVLADVFKAAGEDDIATVLGLRDIATELENVGQVSEDLIAIDRDLLEVEEDLARAELALSKQVGETSAQYEVFSTRLRFAVIKSISDTLELLGKLPAVFKGGVEAAKVFAQNVGSTFQNLGLAAKEEFLEIQAAIKGTFGGNTEAIEEDIRQIQDKRQKIADEARSVAEAFNNAYNEEIEKGLKRAEKNEEQRQRILGGSVRRGDDGGGVDRSGLAARERRERERSLKEEERFFKEKGELVRRLSKEIVDTSIELIEDEEKAKIEAERSASEERIAQLKEEEDKIVEAAKETEKRLIAAFGESSEEVLDFRKKNAETAIEVRKKFGELEEAEVKALNERIAELEKEFAEDANKRRLEQIAKDLEAIEQGSEDEVRALEIARAKGLESEEEFAEKSFEVAKEGLQKRIDLLEASELELEIRSAIEEIPEEDINEVRRQKEDLVLELARLEEKRTAKVEEEAEKRIEKQREEFEQVSELVGEGIETLGLFFEAAKEAEVDAIEEEIEARDAYVERLESRLKKATKVEKEQLEKRIEAEKASIAELEEKKEEAERAFAAKKKALAIVQTIIAGAQGIVQTGANLGYPIAIPFQILQGIQTAAQIALIAAQPLATGGLVEGEQPNRVRGRIPKLNSGKVTVAANVNTLPSGDNVVVAVKRGEMLLNEKQQMRARMLFGNDVFKMLQVPGFVEGGVVDGDIVLGAPDVGLSTGLGNDGRELFAAMERKTDAINARIDRLQVFVSTEAITEDINEGIEVEVISEL